MWQERETLERKSEKTNVAPDSDWEREISKEDLVIDLKDNTVEDEVPTEPFKTFLSFLILSSGFVATSTSLAMTHDRVPDTEPLPDVILDNVKYQAWGLQVSEILLMITMVTAVLVVLFHNCRLVILRRIWLLLGILYWYRAITMSITVLPRADVFYNCQARAENISGDLVMRRVLTIMSGGGLSISGRQVSQ